MCPKPAPTDGLPEPETAPTPPHGSAGACNSGAAGDLSAAPVARTYRFEIFRYNPTAGDPPRFQTYELIAERNLSVLEALLRIQDEQEPGLAFRSACRGAVCGSCAMSVNGQLQLACRVQLGSLRGSRVVLEPLPGFEIAKDLVVDLQPFWEQYQRVQPWLHAAFAGTQESRMSEGQRARIDQFVNCILCGLCYAACPARRWNENFTGPAALAKLYRFLADPREAREPHTLQQENSEDGAWGCRGIRACNEACPKEVRPADGIRGVRGELVRQQLRRVWGRPQTHALAPGLQGEGAGAGPNDQAVPGEARRHEA